MSYFAQKPHLKPPAGEAGDSDRPVKQRRKRRKRRSKSPA